MTDKYQKLRNDLAAAIADAERQGGVNERAEQIVALLAERDALAAAPVSAEPLFWYRPRSDDGYEGPLHNSRVGDVRKASGAWVPLFAGTAPVSAEPVAWFVDWPGEPDLGHYLAEAPVDGARSRPLVFLDAAPVAAQAVDVSANIQRIIDLASNALPADIPKALRLIVGECWKIQEAIAAQAQQPVSGADGLRDQGKPWSGWACQYPGKLPRLYGDKAIAELNHHPEEGDRLFQLAECAQQDGGKVDVWQCTTTLQESDDLIWLYCQDTHTIDGPVKSNPEFIDAWTHWAWVEHPSTAAIDATRKEPDQ